MSCQKDKVPKVEKSMRGRQRVFLTSEVWKSTLASNNTSIRGAQSLTVYFNLYKDNTNNCLCLHLLQHNSTPDLETLRQVSHPPPVSQETNSNSLVECIVFFCLFRQMNPHQSTSWTCFFFFLISKIYNESTKKRRQSYNELSVTTTLVKK